MFDPQPTSYWLTGLSMICNDKYASYVVLHYVILAEVDLGFFENSAVGFFETCSAELNYKWFDEKQISPAWTKTTRRVKFEPYLTIW